MEKVINNIIRSVAYSIGGLFSGSIIMSIIIGLAAQTHDSITISGIKSGYGAGVFASIFVIMTGFIPVLLYGAPLYALTRLYGRASFLLSALIGAAPGVFLYILSKKAQAYYS